MSVETREALEKALTAHMADECEGLLDYAANQHTAYVEDQLIDQNDDEDDDL